jgi:hypothetical protein
MPLRQEDSKLPRASEYSASLRTRYCQFAGLPVSWFSVPGTIVVPRWEYYYYTRVVLPGTLVLASTVVVLSGYSTLSSTVIVRVWETAIFCLMICFLDPRRWHGKSSPRGPDGGGSRLRCGLDGRTCTGGQPWRRGLSHGGRSQRCTPDSGTLRHAAALSYRVSTNARLSPPPSESRETERQTSVDRKRRQRDSRGCPEAANHSQQRNGSRSAVTP